jgi:hypothetical protein
MYLMKLKCTFRNDEEWILVHTDIERYNARRTEICPRGTILRFDLKDLLINKNY